MVDFGTTRGHEPAGSRPGLVISVDAFNQGPAGLVVVLPLTSKAKGIPSHVEVTPPEAGLKKRSFIKCEDVRSVTKDRLAKHYGAVSASTLAQVEFRLRVLLDL